MNKNILDIATKKFQKLSEEYGGSINVGVDNWRGWRFILDTDDVRNCKNECEKCALYCLLKDEQVRAGSFSATLYKANQEDKKLFGFQNFLNCKTLKQYEDCFVNFIVNKATTEKEIKEELILVKNFRLIFSKNTNNLLKKEKSFKKSVIKKLLNQAVSSKKIIIKKIVQKNGL
ncbi:MAG: hypothetical protein NTV62_02715 [Candidatus Gribaldobacteria bacterium]|nr:hypothetical protein [Candidatus Gribaldobacteria bacterium]